MLEEREGKCFEITQHSKSSSSEELEKYFTECIRKSEGAARLLEKELSRI
jgi:hypothetical protein